MIDTISSFVVAIEAKDEYLKGHSARVSLYAGEIGKAMGLAASQIAYGAQGRILHDLGKLVLKDATYRHPAALTYEGSDLMREHPGHGAEILKPLRFLSDEAEAIRRHHERYDGGGYPGGLTGDQIPIAARIIALADAFDDMTASRPYRTAMPIESAVQEVVRQAGARFDPAITAVFARIAVGRLTEIAGFYESRRHRRQRGLHAGPPPGWPGRLGPAPPRRRGEARDRHPHQGHRHLPRHRPPSRAGSLTRPPSSAPGPGRSASRRVPARPSRLLHFAPARWSAWIDSEQRRGH